MDVRKRSQKSSESEESVVKLRNEHLQEYSGEERKILEEVVKKYGTNYNAEDYPPILKSLEDARSREQQEARGEEPSLRFTFFQYAIALFVTVYFFSCNFSGCNINLLACFLLLLQTTSSPYY